MMELCTAFSVLNDAYMFPLFEVGILIIFLYAFWRSWRSSRPPKTPAGIAFNVTIGVKISDKARTLLYGFYGAVAVILLNLPLRVEAPVARDYRVVWVVFNLGIAVYLCLFNSWGRNTIIGWANKFENKIDRIVGS